jgi:uncharacterized membrane protein
MFSKIFWKGLIVVLPVSISLGVLSWITSKIEGMLGGFISSIIGEDNYFSGLGLIISFLLILLVGSLVSNYITKRFVNYILDLFGRIPFLRTIYGPVKDLMSLFGGADSTSNMKRVVWVEFDQNSGRRLGLVTRDRFDDLNLSEETVDYIAVYIPLSFMFGGYTTLIHKSKIRTSDIPVEQALKLAITGWVRARDD